MPVFLNHPGYNKFKLTHVLVPIVSDIKLREIGEMGQASFLVFSVLISFSDYRICAYGRHAATAQIPAIPKPTHLG